MSSMSSDVCRAHHSGLAPFHARRPCMTESTATGRRGTSEIRVTASCTIRCTPTLSRGKGERERHAPVHYRRPHMPGHARWLAVEAAGWLQPFRITGTNSRSALFSADAPSFLQHVTVVGVGARGGGGGKTQRADKPEIISMTTQFVDDGDAPCSRPSVIARGWARGMKTISQGSDRWRRRGFGMRAVKSSLRAP